MSEEAARILLVEDSAPLALVYMQYLSTLPYQITHVSTGADAISAIKHQSPDIILLDLHLPDMNGREVLDAVKKIGLHCPVIVITSHGSLDLAIDIMRAGAADFLEKPFNADRLTVTIQNAARRFELEQFVELHTSDSFRGFIGSSLPMQAVYRIIKSAAASKATVFITGESGTGKEVCAQAIHDESSRSEQAFVALNCASIPKDLLESEVFGHVKGAFTGAVSAREGAAARADGGTLFLDEICELDIDLQSKLLRFIQSSTFQKVGSNVLQHADIRFLCATNRDPLEEVKAGRFREDLYYRLHVIPITLPALRLRQQDIMLICQHFLMQYCAEEGRHFTGFSEQATKILHNYPWPGNIRQLQNVMRNIVVLNDEALVTPQMLPPPLDAVALDVAEPSPAVLDTDSAAPIPAPESQMSIQPLWEVEKYVIERAIRLCGDNIPKAAALLDISPSTIYRKRQQWETAERTTRSPEPTGQQHDA
jgi:two-component system repressor protein LuxO